MVISKTLYTLNIILTNNIYVLIIFKDFRSK